jgi:azurin
MYRIQNIHFNAEKLQWKNGTSITDIAMDNMRLNRQDPRIHAQCREYDVLRSTAVEP